MKQKIQLRLIMLCVLFVTLGLNIAAQGENLALTTANLNARTGPEQTASVITQFPYGSTVAVLARNDVGNWLFVRSIDNGIEGWVSAGYLNLPGNLDVLTLPIRAAEVSQQPAPADQPQAESGGQVALSGSGLGETITLLNVRVAPDQETIVQIPAKTKVAIESRNRIGNWILIRTPDGVIRGWVASRYVDFGEGVALEALPISSEIMGATEGEQALSDFNPVIRLPEGENAELAQRLANVPLFHNFRTSRVYSIFKLGLEKGNRPNVFMKVGDSVTASQPFLYGYGQGTYNLGGYGYLQTTIDYFAAVSPYTGVANSFTNTSQSAITGATSASMLDGIWGDPNYCGGNSPLMCEIILSRPSVALVLFGTQDMRVIEAFEFRIYMSQIVEAMMYNGVIPVLSTFHSTEAYYGDQALIYNNIILDVANDYDVPLINLWRATQPLPDNGVNLQDPVHLSQGEANAYNFTGEENQYGINMRNLLSLQALDELRKNVLTQ